MATNPPPNDAPPTTPPAPTQPAPNEPTLEERVKAIIAKHEANQPPSTPPAPTQTQPSTGDLEAQVLAILNRKDSETSKDKKLNELETLVKELTAKVPAKKKWWQPFTPLASD